jgi:hypothetical protein
VRKRLHKTINYKHINYKPKIIRTFAAQNMIEDEESIVDIGYHCSRIRDRPYWRQFLYARLFSGS